MGWFILFVFYVMVGIVTLDMSRTITRRSRQLEPHPRPAEGPSPSVTRAYGRMLRARQAGVLTMT